MIIQSNSAAVRKGLSGLHGLRGRAMGCSACGRSRGMGRLRRRLGQDDSGLDYSGGVNFDTGLPDSGLPGGIPVVNAPSYSGGFPDTSSGTIEVLGPTNNAATLNEMGISTAGMSNSQISSLLSSVMQGTATAVTGLTASGVFGQPSTTVISQPSSLGSLSSLLPLILLGGGGLLLVMAVSGRRR